MGELNPKPVAPLSSFLALATAHKPVFKKMPMTSREAEPIFPGWFPILVQARIALLQAASVM